MKFWQLATSVSPKKQAAVVFLTLTGKARDAVLEMDPDELNVDNGLDLLYEKLDGLFKEDRNQATLNAYEKFERYKRQPEMNISDFRVEFDRLVQQLKSYKIELPEAVLSYRALKSANLSSENEKLVRATVADINLKDMMLQIQKVVGVEAPKAVDSPDRLVVIKQEPEINYVSEPSVVEGESTSAYQGEEAYYGQSYSGRGNQGRGIRRGGYGRRGGREARFNRGNRKTNPPGPDGKTSTCAICGSFMHWVRNCPHKEDTGKNGYVPPKDPEAEAHIILMNLNEQSESLLGQTVGAAILDSGCSRTVCGNQWYECFKETLSDKQKCELVLAQSDGVFRFGNGAELRSLFKVKIPCLLAGKSVEIWTDVIESPIPMLLSKASMKKANCLLDFSSDTLSIFGNPVNLQCTSSGHYYVNLSRLSSQQNVSEVLFVKGMSQKSEGEKRKIVTKLHRQFSHPTSEKLTKLVENSGVNDKKFLALIEEVSSQCDFCQRYKKSKPKPVVGMPLASVFNELVAMDIKVIKGHKVLHMIDHATRYSMACPLKSKEPKEVLRVVMKHWVAYFGSPNSFLVDNGGEFDNDEYRDMAQNLNSVLRTTAAYSPWSNGLVERHNAILGEMVVKTLEDVQCSLDIAVSWAVSAKNTLANVHGFSANQLVFGSNPNTPSVLNNAPPALEGVSTSETVARNLNAMHAARRAFMKSESSERLQRALRHQIRGGEGNNFDTGDMVYFKRPNVQRWMGPGTVIGRENKQVLVKHGGTYVRVHPCRLQRYQSRGLPLEASNPMNREASDSPDSMDEVLPEISEVDIEDNIEALGVEPERDGINASSADCAEEVNAPEEVADHSDKNKQVCRHPTSRRSKVDTKWNLPQPGDVIQCRLYANADPTQWTNMRVISRGGKATGSNKFVMNVSVDGDRPTWVDFKKSVAEWKLQTESDSESSLESEQSFASVDDVLAVQEKIGLDWAAAKASELKSWELNSVYTEVEDRGQDRIQCRWICSTKESAAGKLTKARLVAKGFQDTGAGSTRSDSPTCAKESLRIVLMLIAANDWKLNSMDIKTAFLQGKKFERDVFIIPPVEAKVKEGRLWKLNKCVYGLTDASRVWYLTVREELVKLGMKPSVHDEAIFTFEWDNKLHGVVSTHVDDFCWAGSQKFEEQVIGKLRLVFKVKSEEKYSFKYLGLDLSQENDKIIVKQDLYVQKIDLIRLERKCEPSEYMTEDEVSQCRGALGKLNWLATQTRPDLSFQVSELTSALSNRKVEVIHGINRAIRKAKRESSQLTIPRMSNFQRCKLVTYSDASFANIEGTKSQGGYITYVSDGECSFPLAWQSQRVKRTVKSTQAAETLAMVDAAEASLYYQSFLQEVLHASQKSIFPIQCKTDNASLHASVHSNTQILDKRLRIETAILREMLAKGEIVSLSWVPTKYQLADSLTKSGAPSNRVH